MPPILFRSVVIFTMLSFSGCDESQVSQESDGQGSLIIEQGNTKTATFGAGCYWCTEAVFEQLEGVKNVESGFAYAKDETVKPAEACVVYYDESIISYDELLEVFWKMHDPTTPNRQGADIGPEYRSMIFYHDDQQRKLAEHYMQKLSDAKAFSDPIVTEIVENGRFERARDDQQNYYRSNIHNKHCQLVIKPKVDKIKQVFADKIKKK